MLQLSGVSVLGLGALNKAEFINRGGEDTLNAFEPRKTRWDLLARRLCLPDDGSATCSSSSRGKAGGGGAFCRDGITCATSACRFHVASVPPLVRVDESPFSLQFIAVLALTLPRPLVSFFALLARLSVCFGRQCCPLPWQARSREHPYRCRSRRECEGRCRCRCRSEGNRCERAVLCETVSRVLDRSHVKGR